MKQLVFATNNANKIREIKEIVGSYIEVLSLSDIGCNEEIPETADTFAGNALQKAVFVKEKYGYDCFADDSGLEVASLNNEPGVYSARYAGEPQDPARNMDKLLANLANNTHRAAAFKTTIALIYEGETHYFEGVIAGEIITEKRGDGGFGYDPIFVPHGYTTTFAEMGKETKNQISHRAIAVKRLINFLQQNKTV